MNEQGCLTFDQATMADLSTIKTQLTSESLFQAFKTQLAKDFEQSKFSTDFISTLESDYNFILEKILRELQHSKMTTDANVMQLLYRIDIGESQLKKYLYAQKEEDPLRVMAELIIKRVLQKVVTKQFYKNKD